MNTQTRFGMGALAAVLLASATVQPAAAATVEYWLRVVEVSRNVNQAGVNVPVTMWRYNSCAANFVGCVALNNGGVLRAAAGDTLVVHVQNLLRRGATLISLPGVAAFGGLPVPTSILIPGLPSPSFQAGPTLPGACPVGASAPVEVAGGGRIRSFTSEVANVAAAAAAVGTYCWTSLQPGTYIYQSGTHPAVQVQMGLYGALVVDGAAGTCGAGTRCAYPDIAYDREVVAVFSEIDPRVHAKVADSTYGDANAADPMTSTIFYEPQYFFVDGEVSDGTNPPVAYRSKANVAAGAATQRILLRLVNTGIEPHAPLLKGERFTPVAEDGNPYTASSALHPQYSTLLAAGKALDAILTPAAAGTYVLFDRHRGLANTGGGAGGVNASGMLVNLVVAP
jgi:FtsP/CotA-like multicopper oxidase with cupredoxin domain